MQVKVISVSDKNKCHITKGHNAIGETGFLSVLFDRFQIGNLLLTSRVEKITVETKNSVYELEVVDERN